MSSGVLNDNNRFIQNAVPVAARPLPLSPARVTGGPLKRAQDPNAEYLLKLEPDRLMAYYRNRTALDLEIKFAAWAETILSKLNPYFD